MCGSGKPHAPWQTSEERTRVKMFHDSVRAAQPDLWNLIRVDLWKGMHNQMANTICNPPTFLPVDRNTCS